MKFALFIEVSVTFISFLDATGQSKQTRCVLRASLCLRLQEGKPTAEQVERTILVRRASNSSAICHWNELSWRRLSSVNPLSDGRISRLTPARTDGVVNRST